MVAEALRQLSRFCWRCLVVAGASWWSIYDPWTRCIVGLRPSGVEPPAGTQSWLDEFVARETERGVAAIEAFLTLYDSEPPRPGL